MYTSAEAISRILIFAVTIVSALFLAYQATAHAGKIKMVLRILIALIAGVSTIIIAYFVYLNLPWTAGTISSPYGNAEIKNVVLGHNIFFAVYVDR